MIRPASPAWWWRSSGQVLLAAAPDGVRERLLDRLDLRAYGPRAPLDRDAVERTLQRVRHEQAACCHDIHAAGISALAVPVVDGAGAWIAALGCALPTSRSTRQHDRELLELLREAAARIADSWGC
ncbi:MAG: IclR family transcriptional regulator domain-containing protein [Planctomycetota bacterium]